MTTVLGKRKSTGAEESSAKVQKPEGAQFWLLKGDPDFTLKELEASKDATHIWDGVRGHQAKNFIKQMKVGQLGFFYETGSSPCITGIVEVRYTSISRVRLYSSFEQIVSEPFPDPTAWTGPSKDPKSTKENPVWFSVLTISLCSGLHFFDCPSCAGKCEITLSVFVPDSSERTEISQRRRRSA